MSSRRPRSDDRSSDERDSKRLALPAEEEEDHEDDDDQDDDDRVEVTDDPREGGKLHKTELYGSIRELALEPDLLTEEVIRQFERIDDCLNHEDGLNLFTLLHSMNFLECFTADMVRVHDDDDDDDDNDDDDGIGRITWLNLSHWGLAFDLPPIIGSLRHIQVLNLFNCLSIPREIGNLQFLRKLYLCQCPASLLDELPEGITALETLEEIHVLSPGAATYERRTAPVLAWTKLEVPALKSLWFCDLIHSDVEKVLCALKAADRSLVWNLKRLTFESCELLEQAASHSSEQISRSSEIEYSYLVNPHQFGDLLLEVIPRFPNFRELVLEGGYLRKETLRVIEKRILDQRERGVVLSSARDNNNINNNSLFKLYLTNLKFEITAQPFEEVSDDEDENKDAKDKEENSKKDKEALMTILDTCNGIYALCANHLNQNTSFFAPEVEHRLRINHSGWKYISGGQGQVAIKTALWPMILERAYQTSADIYNLCGATNDGDSDSEDEESEAFRNRIEASKCATGVYHLLRHGPLLFSGNAFHRT